MAADESIVECLTVMEQFTAEGQSWDVRGHQYVDEAWMLRECKDKLCEVAIEKPVIFFCQPFIPSIRGMLDEVSIEVN